MPFVETSHAPGYTVLKDPESWTVRVGDLVSRGSARSGVGANQKKFYTNTVNLKDPGNWMNETGPEDIERPVVTGSLDSTKPDSQSLFIPTAAAVVDGSIRRGQ